MVGLLGELLDYHGNAFGGPTYAQENHSLELFPFVNGSHEHRFLSPCLKLISFFLERKWLILRYRLIFVGNIPI